MFFVLFPFFSDLCSLFEVIRCVYVIELIDANFCEYSMV